MFCNSQIVYTAAYKANMITLKHPHELKVYVYTVYIIRLIHSSTVIQQQLHRLKVAELRSHKQGGRTVLYMHDFNADR